MLNQRAASRREMELTRSQLGRERDALDAAIGEYDGYLSEVGVANGRSAAITGGELEVLCSNLARVASELEDVASQMWSRLEQLRRESHEATERAHATRAELERAVSEQGRISQAREQLASDPRAHQEIGLDSPLESVVARKQLVELELRAGEQSLERGAQIRRCSAARVE